MNRGVVVTRLPTSLSPGAAIVVQAEQKVDQDLAKIEAEKELIREKLDARKRADVEEARLRADEAKLRADKEALARDEQTADILGLGEQGRASPEPNFSFLGGNPEQQGDILGRRSRSPKSKRSCAKRHMNWIRSKGKKSYCRAKHHSVQW